MNKKLISMLAIYLVASIAWANDMSIVNDALKSYENFPKPGVKFYDVGGILQNPSAMRIVIDNLVEHYRDKNIQGIIAVDARGFLFATPLAYKLNVPVIMVRKPGKLPGRTIATKYSKEYGKDDLEMQVDALAPKQRVIIIDDLVVTGGTLRAAINLARMSGAEVIEVASIIEITSFKKDRDIDVPVYSVIQK